MIQIVSVRGQHPISPKAEGGPLHNSSVSNEVEHLNSGWPETNAWMTKEDFIQPLCMSTFIQIFALTCQDIWVWTKFYPSVWSLQVKPWDQWHQQDHLPLDVLLCRWETSPFYRVESQDHARGCLLVGVWLVEWRHPGISDKELVPNPGFVTLATMSLGNTLNFS